MDNILRTEFSLSFNREGELRSVDTGKRFEFDVYHGDKDKNQARYERLCNVIIEHVYLLLEKEGLKRVPVLPNSQSFFFASPDALTTEKLLIIVHGSGAVRAGMWSRRVIINANIDSGTQLPYIRRARKLGWGVIVTNTNLNEVPASSSPKTKRQRIRGSSCPQEHFLSVWDKYVERSSASRVGIIAHSYGGVVCTDVAMLRKCFRRRVVGVAFTDSVHKLYPNYLCREWVQKQCVNWVCSRKPLDTILSSPENECECRSAGTVEHEWTSASAFNPVMQFIESCMRRPLNDVIASVRTTRTLDRLSANLVGAEEAPSLVWRRGLAEKKRAAESRAAAREIKIARHS
eukprot:Rmarinus@m.3669